MTPLLVALALAGICPEGYREHPLELDRHLADPDAPADLLPAVSFCDNLAQRKSTNGPEGQIVGQADLFVIVYSNKGKSNKYIGISRPTAERTETPLPVASGPHRACQGLDVFLVPVSGALTQVLPMLDQQEPEKIVLALPLTVLGKQPICSDETDRHLLWFKMAKPPAPTR